MTEEMTEAYRRGEIETYQLAIRMILASLPEATGQAIAGLMADRARRCEEIAERLQTDPARDHAEAAYDVSAKLTEALEEWKDQVRSSP